MNRSVAEAARILGVVGQKVKKLAWAHKHHLGPQANPAKGNPRTFTDTDMLAMMYICDHLEEEQGEEISVGLEREEQYVVGTKLGVRPVSATLRR